jgi:hypothetical protein
MSDAPQGSEPPSSYQTMLQTSSVLSQKAEFRRSTQERQTPIDSGWDVVEELPLRWATDHVPLAVPGSRLMNASVLTYALWRNDDQPRGSALLAVAIKSAVLLYESPKGERAFRFVKVSRNNLTTTILTYALARPRNFTLRCSLAASLLYIRASKTTFPGAFRTGRAPCGPRRSTRPRDEAEDLATACASARRR